jgi:Ca2+-transporting ATPase
MGERGTDVAREAASMVLVDDNFASIVRGIRGGRRIFGNLRKSMGYIFAIHIPIAGMAVLPVLLALPPVLLPLHIALIELIVDPACSLAFESEPEDADVMDRPPRDTRAALFGAAAMWQATGQGALMLGGAALAYLASVTEQWGSHTSVTAERTRSMVLMAFVVGNAALIFISKSRRSGSGSARTPINWVAVLVSVLAVSAVALAIYWPWLGAALRLQSLDGASLLLAAVCGLPGLVVWALWKLRP